MQNGLPAITDGLTKTQIALTAQEAVNYVLETGGPERVAEQMVAMEAFIKEVKANPKFMDYVRTEIAKHPGGKMTTASGAKIELMEAGTTYNFDDCGDTELPKLKAKLEEAKRQVKHREEFLKAAPEGGCEIIVEGGEVITIYPPLKSSISTYKVTLAR